MGKRAALASSLQDLSREDLIKMILKHEPHLVDKMSKKSKNERVFDAESYPFRHVALKVAYFGARYQGFASQVGLKALAAGTGPACPANTVEDHLFRAMLQTKLILNPETCQYSRCGRTDAGVSSTGQVIALRLRSSASKTGQEEMNYARILNKQLPDDIRVLDWAFVKDTFSARFSCSSRLYHYYFAKKHYDSALRQVVDLDVGLMSKAAGMLVGVHDFRNFCRKDASKPDQTYVREIYQAYTEPVPGVESFYRFVCKGSAFLYHQIRCIMSILFMIGSGREPIEVIPEMLSALKDNVSGPVVHYELASEVPLVLYECEFKRNPEEDVVWVGSGDNGHTETHLHHLWELKQAESLIHFGILEGKQECSKVPTGSIYNQLKKLK